MAQRVKRERRSNIELLRIVAMLGIIVYHIVLHRVSVQLTDLASIARMENGLFSKPVFYPRLVLLDFIMPLGNVGNALFIMISGYFLIGRGDRIDVARTAKKLLAQLAFAVAALMLVSARVHQAHPELYLELIPFTKFNSVSWFVGYYLVVVLLAKYFLNRRIAAADRRQLESALVVGFALLQFRWSRNLVGGIGTGFQQLATGVFFYALGAYIRRFDPFGRVRGFVLPLVAAVAYWAIYVSARNVAQTNIQEYLRDAQAAAQAGRAVEPFVQSVMSFSAPSVFVVVLAVVLFEAFRRLRLPVSRVVNFLASGTFMVYLFHDNDFFRTLWDKVDWVTLLYRSPTLFLAELLLWAIQTFLAGLLVYLAYLGVCWLWGQCLWVFVREPPRG